VIVTRYGKPVAAIVGPSEWERLKVLQAAGPETGLARLVGSFGDADEFFDGLASVRVERSSPRPLPELG